MKRILLLIIFASLFFASATPIEAVESKKGSGQSENRKVLHGEIDMVVSSCVAAGVTFTSTSFPTTIAKVRIGSPAVYAGLAEGDKVISAQITDNNKLGLLIERKGQKFYAQMKTSPQLDTQQAKTSGGLSTDSTVDAQTLNRQTAILRNLFVNHDLTLLIDRSNSMATPDCPDYVSRWQWCAKQSTDLARIAASAASSISMIFFNHQYNIWRNIQPENIPALFAHYSTAGGTLLSRPLAEELDYHFQWRNRPLIILIISDGTPTDSPGVALVLREARKRIKYLGEVTIIFVLIGTEMNSDLLRAQFNQVDEGTIANGCMFNVIPFIKVSSRGLRPVLAEQLAILRAANTVNVNKAAPTK